MGEKKPKLRIQITVDDDGWWTWELFRGEDKQHFRMGADKNYIVAVGEAREAFAVVSERDAVWTGKWWR